MFTSSGGTKTKKQNTNTPCSYLYWFLLPSLLGMTLFYFLPFLMSFRYALSSEVRTFEFVWFNNYVTLLQNTIFLRALKNTLFFIIVCVPLNMLFSFLIASGLRKITHFKSVLALIFALPLVVPSGAVVFFWRALFTTEGLLNRLMMEFGYRPINWLDSQYAMPIIVLVFLWKNLGFNIILFQAGLELIPQEYNEYAKMEGAGALYIFRKITFVFLAPTSFLVLLMSIINSFRSFREIHLLFGSLPRGNIYMFQHYITSQFINLNLPALTTASHILALIVVIVTFTLYTAQKRVSEFFSL